jgi:hypothetical protein
MLLQAERKYFFSAGYAYWKLSALGSPVFICLTKLSIVTLKHCIAHKSLQLGPRWTTTADEAPDLEISLTKPSRLFVPNTKLGGWYKRHKMAPRTQENRICTCEARGMTQRKATAQENSYRTSVSWYWDPTDFRPPVVPGRFWWVSSAREGVLVVGGIGVAVTGRSGCGNPEGRHSRVPPLTIQELSHASEPFDLLMMTAEIGRPWWSGYRRLAESRELIRVWMESFLN